MLAARPAPCGAVTPNAGTPLLRSSSNQATPRGGPDCKVLDSSVASDSLHVGKGAPLSSGMDSTNSMLTEQGRSWVADVVAAPGSDKQGAKGRRLKLDVRVRGPGHGLGALRASGLL